MPQHDPNDEDFWTRSRRTRQSDKRSKRGRKRKDGEPGGNEIDWTDPELPSAAPPTARSRREQGPSQQPPTTQQRPVSPRVTAAQQRPPAQAAPQGHDPRSGRGPEPRRQPQPEAPAARGEFVDQPPARRGASGAGSAPPAAFGTPPTTQIPQAGTRPSRAGRSVPQPSGAPGAAARPSQLQQPTAPGSGRSAQQPPSVPGPGGRASAASTSQFPGGAGDPGAPGSSGRRSAASSARTGGAAAAARPDTIRSPGSARRRARDAAGSPDAGGEWTDPSSTNGPHLASRGSRSPALGSPQPWQGSAPAAVAGPPASGGTPLVPGMPRAGAREAAQAATQAVPTVPGNPRARSREGGQAAPARPSARELQQSTPLVPGMPRAGSREQGGAATAAAPLAPLPSRRDRERDRPLGRADDLDGGPPTQAIGRVTGENPALVDRLEGLASRATPPHGGARASSGHSQLDSHEPLAPDPLVDQRSVAPPQPPSTRSLAPTPAPGRGPAPGPGYEEPYDDRYGGDLYDDSYTDEPYDDFEDELAEPSRRPGCSRSLMALAAVAVVLVIILLAVGFWVKGKIDPGGESGERVRVEVVAGQSTSEIGATLEEAGIISSSSVWSWYVRFKGGGDIQAGVYEIPTNLSMGEALDELGKKPLPPGTKRATVPEGQTIAQIKQRLTVSDNKIDGFTPEGFDAALADPAVRSKYLPADQASLEGTFFPETYDLAEDGDEVALLAKMRDQFDATMDELGATDGAAALQRTPYEIMIIASIVEEEARVDEDRPKVARVIYNRLANDEALFIDAINCYEKGEVPCVLTDADFARESAYNSRKTRGLPPTPIAAPGKASIDAALHPADGDWTFYVLDPNLPEGHHLFTSSQQEFNAAKARCRDAGLGCG